jgi:hypothetical protein
MWTIDVDAGETVTFSMQALTGDLDAYLAIFTPDMEEVLTEDDDSMGGTDSQLTFTFQAADDYVIIATRYDTDEGDTSGNYRLTAERLGVESAPSEPIIPNDVADLTITNFSGTTLCGIWISPSTEDSWGEEWLAASGEQALAYEFFITWEVPVDSYDIHVEDCDEGYLEEYFVAVEQATEVEVYPNQMILK